MIDNGEYSLAKVNWNNKEELGIRWNVTIRDKELQNFDKVCTGLPQSRGYPTWFILPNYQEDLIKELEKQMNINQKFKSLNLKK